VLYIQDPLFLAPETEEIRVPEVDTIPEVVQPKLPKRFHWNVSGECRMQLVETVPATLVTHNFAEEMKVEHMSTMEVSSSGGQFIKRVFLAFGIDKSTNHRCKVAA
jgi:putative lipoic acid-binding regulatory protein